MIQGSARCALRFRRPAAPGGRRPSCGCRRPHSPLFQEIAERVTSGEFVGTRNLIVGGSRGIGEFTAKALAAGGGEVTITYAVGREEAERVAAEILQWGGKCTVIPYNVLHPSPEVLDGIASELTHAYYFATPGIARAKRPLFDPATFALFQRFYIDGFFDLCRKIARRANPVQVFYPSTVFVAERPKEFAEYAMAKAAGEILCADLNRSLPGIRVFSTRLPRLETDQSPDSVLTENADIFEIMLPLIRAMQSEAALARDE